ncbi:hypothetical protein DPMN_151296 [Dreissena polymorpha]|uniref:Uncharacterized protein n=1 Tax=Dreissena polymorpha TaxID=45954 RepID=A0A9D4FES7_DREPO|nr:hypothetical protein DPMN_151296 [Dreissena polymorpha]
MNVAKEKSIEEHLYLYRWKTHLQLVLRINLMGGSSNEQHDITIKLYELTGAYRMEVSMVKSKTMVYGTRNTSRGIVFNGEKLEEVTSATLRNPVEPCYNYR